MIKINWDKIEQIFLEAIEIAEKWDKEKSFWDDFFTFYGDNQDYYLDMWPFNSAVLNPHIFPTAKRNREDFITDEENIRYLNEIVFVCDRIYQSAVRTSWKSHWDWFFWEMFAWEEKKKEWAMRLNLLKQYLIKIRELQLFAAQEHDKIKPFRNKVWFIKDLTDWDYEIESRK